MKWWIAVCVMQILYMLLPPMRYWWPYYRKYKCYRNKCRCRGMFSLHDVPPNIEQAMKDDVISYEFANTAWNILEGRNLTIRQREQIDVVKYFNGFRGPR